MVEEHPAGPAEAGSVDGPNQIGPPPAPPDRLKALADGVFAIAMTLLVLELGVPIVSGGDADLIAALGEMWPDFVMYVLSFAVLGVYWLLHDMVFDAIDRSDSTLIWLNILYLMLAALIPFGTALVVAYDAMTVTAVFYGANLLLLFLVMWSMWGYAISKNLIASHVDPNLARGARTMGLIYVGAFAVSFVLAFFVPTVSMVMYGAIVVGIIGFTVAGRTDTVIIWQAVRRDED